ncbi:arginine--tRNA ligase [Candidatus Gottesmanbacteria bacterium]|nr:arginine--tRNA ligase [Candidatus Gottesmanbacteria bacterium]
MKDQKSPLDRPKLFTNLDWEKEPSYVALLGDMVKQVVVTAFPENLSKVKSFSIHLEHPGSFHYGDYSTNVAFRLAGVLKKSPLELAKQISDQVNKYIKTNQTTSFISDSVHLQGMENGKNGGKLTYRDILEKADVAGPGFINLWIRKEVFITLISQLLNYKKADKSTKFTTIPLAHVLEGKKIFLEFAHPNTLKEFHIGHLRNISIGESLVRILEAVGTEVFRANYEGDVGLHVAKAIWGVKKILEREKIELDHIRRFTPREKAKFLGRAYAQGSQAYEKDKKVQKEIIGMNKAIYEDPKSVALWEETRGWSLEYFDSIYKRVGTYFDRLFFESEVERQGRELVIEAVKSGIFIKDKDGSIYFPGKKYGLNNCVFVTSENYATYEGKEVALEELEYNTFPYDLSINNVANEQSNFFQIGYKATEILFPRHKGKHFHLAYGMVHLKSGKMSSRTGQVITADSLFDEAKEKILKIMEKSKIGKGEGNKADISEKVSVAAVKYSMLRVNPKIDIAFDLEESVSLDGDSGPYLLYTYARCKSVLRKWKSANKSKSQIDESSLKLSSLELNTEEEVLLRTLYRFPEVVLGSAETLSPNLLCSYLFQIAGKFNVFYNKHSILGSGNKSGSTSTEFRLFLTTATAHILNKGLYLLGIETVERM